VSSRSESNNMGHKLKILLVEDNSINRLLAEKILEKYGHKVTSASNGREAVQLWDQNRSSQFDIILMDVQMPEMDGLQAATYIRQKEQLTGARIPIVAMTAHAMKGDRERCLESGMDGYVTKPITPAGLASAIAAALPVRPKSTNPPALDASQKEKMSKEMLARFDGDAELMKELAEIFLQSSPKTMAEIREAAKVRDAKALEHSAHALKGSVGNFISDGARETAENLEFLAKSGNLPSLAEIVSTLEQQIAEFTEVLIGVVAEKVH
jgi:two-component system, sensor histidine kinase and response regulator